MRLEFKLSFLALCTGTVLGVGLPVLAQMSTLPITQPQTKLPIQSLVEVKTIYIGYIQGDTLRTQCFRAELSQYLNKYGFTVAAVQEDADATLLGSFDVYGYRPFLSSRAKVVLIDPKYKQLWKYTTATPWLGNSILKFGPMFTAPHSCDSVSAGWRAIYIAQALKKAKAQAK
jgi:hypothetical protein